MARRSPDKPCEWCGEMFHPYRHTLRFCSNACSSRSQYQGCSKTANCAVCGVEFVSKYKRDHTGSRRWTKCCGRKCAGRLAWKGGPVASRRRQRYGLEPEEYESMLRRQRGMCALCQEPPPPHGFYVDHCHATGRNRGLLCARCNSWIAPFDALSVDEVLTFWKYAHPTAWRALALAWQETNKERFDVV